MMGQPAVSGRPTEVTPVGGAIFEMKDTEESTIGQAIRNSERPLHSPISNVRIGEDYEFPLLIRWRNGP